MSNKACRFVYGSEDAEYVWSKGSKCVSLTLVTTFESLSATIALNYSLLRDPASSLFLVLQCAHVDVTPVLLVWAFFFLQRKTFHACRQNGWEQNKNEEKELRAIELHTSLFLTGQSFVDQMNISSLSSPMPLGRVFFNSIAVVLRVNSHPPLSLTPFTPLPPRHNGRSCPGSLLMRLLLSL